MLFVIREIFANEKDKVAHLTDYTKLLLFTYSLLTYVYSILNTVLF